MARPKKEVKAVEAPKVTTEDIAKEIETKNDSIIEEVIEEPVQEPNSSVGMKMLYSDKIMSMKNAIKILPPNLIVDGRHTKQNIGAICGFIVNDDMWDLAYEDYSHED